jgi:hypothetical protein
VKVPAVFKSVEGQWVALGLVALSVVYIIGRSVLGAAKKAAVDTAKGAQGVISGNNALTAGTPYEGAGIVGTVAAEANVASGGLFESIGDWLGGHLPGSGNDYDPNAKTGQATSRQQIQADVYNGVTTPW